MKRSHMFSKGRPGLSTQFHPLPGLWEKLLDAHQVLDDAVQGSTEEMFPWKGKFAKAFL